MPASFLAAASDRISGMGITLTLPGTLSGANTHGLLVISSNTASAQTWTPPAGWTTLVGRAVQGTMSYAVFSKQWVSGDQNPMLASTVTGGFVASGVWYAGSDGFEALGSIFAKPGSQTTIDAPSVAGSGTKVAVFVEKASTNTSAPTGHGTSVRTSSFGASGSVNSHLLGDYGTASALKTATYTVASANGIGFQAPVTDSAAPPATPSVRLWEGAAESAPLALSLWSGGTETSITAPLELI